MRARALAMVIVAGAAVAAGDDDFPKIKLSALLDARAAATDEATSWTDAGMGKARYGGEDGDARTLVRAGQATLLLTAFFTDEMWSRVQVNLDLDPDPLFVDRAFDRIDLTEAIWSFRPVLTPHLRLTSRAGLLFPFSIENTGKGWLPVYTVTPSAANTWIGEEVRPIAAELGMLASPEGHEIAFSAAAFGWNDTAGTFFSWRGWAMHDRLVGVRDELPLPNIPAIGEGGVFSRNTPWVEPVREIDGHVGYWLSASWNVLRRFDARAFYYDNKGDPLAFDGQQYAWRTRFGNLALIVPIGPHVEVIAQRLQGNTIMGPRAVDNDFWTHYLLVTGNWGRHRLTARYDVFAVRDRDFLKVEDPNDEDGIAYTLAYLVETGDRHRLAFEAMHVESNRPARATIGLPVDTTELLAQLSFRIWY